LDGAVSVFFDQGDRDTQQDRWTVREEQGVVIAVIADGMGGHQAGDLAAQTLVDVFQTRAFDAAPDVWLLDTLCLANTALAKMASTTLNGAQSGATLLGAVLTETDITWISVGDSTLMCLKGDVMERLNDDHSMRPVDGTGALRAAVSGGPIALVDTGHMDVAKDTHFVLATDGVLAVDLRDVLPANDPQSLTTNIADLWHTAGASVKRDNVATISLSTNAIAQDSNG
jgi:protein phosphatase